MITSYLINPFDKGRYSYANFNLFAEKHVALMASFNGSADLLAATMPLLETFKMLLTNRSTYEGKKQAKTMLLNDLIKEIKKYISRKGGVISDIFHTESPSYQEFFPYGKSEYAKASKKNIQVLVERFRDACVAHQSELGDEIVEKMNAYVQTLADTKTKQNNNISDVKDKISELEEARKALAKQMFINMLTLTIKHIDNTEYVSNYYDTNMLKLKEKKTNGQTETVEQVTT